MTQKDVTSLIKNMDDLEMLSLLSNPRTLTNNAMVSLKLSQPLLKTLFKKFLRNAPMLQAVFYFADIENTGPADVFIPPLSWELDKIIEDIHQSVYEYPEWNNIIKWNDVWRGQIGLPDSPLYLLYSSSERICNTDVQPTSIIINDKTLASEVFGFTPLYVYPEIANKLLYKDGRLILVPVRSAPIIFRSRRKKIEI